MTATRGARPVRHYRSRTGPLLAAGAALLVASAIAAEAAKVPLPHLRPEVAGELRPTQQPKRGFLLFKKPTPAPAPSRFAPAEQQALARISAYFNSFQTMEGQFIQFGPRGEQSEGVFNIARPGKIRFHYSPPVKLDVIADGHNVAIRDNRARTQDIYPLSKTPLRYLLSRNVDLTSDKLVSQVRREPDLISVVIVERSTFVQGKLTLIFDSKSYELKQWIVTDAQGLNTSVAIYNTSVGASPDPGLFRIIYANRP